MIEISDPTSTLRKALTSDRASTADGSVTSPKNDVSSKAESPAESPETLAHIPLWKIFSFFKTSELILALVAIILSVGQGLVFPLMTCGGIPLFKGAFEGTVNTEVASVGRDRFFQMAYLALSLFLTTLVSCLIWNHLSSRVTNRLKNTYFEHILVKPVAWFDHNEAERVSATFCRNIVAVSVALSYKMHFYFFFYSQLIAGILLALYVSPTFTGVLVLLVPFVILVLFLLLRYNQTTEANTNNWKVRAITILEQALRCFKAVKALNAEEHELRNFTHCSANVEVELKRTVTRTALFNGLFLGFMQFTFAMVLGLGFYLVFFNYSNPFSGAALTIDELLFVILAALPGFTSITQIEPIQKSLEKAKAAIAEISELIETQQALAPEANVKLPIRGRIEFQNVTFAYPTNPDKPVLKNVSFVVEPGQKVGVVGSSGSGKTTISQLLSRFYEPQEGSILIDGVNIRDYDPGYLRQNIGLLSQTPILLSLSVRENLTLGANATSDEDILEVLERMQMKDFIYHLPQGLETQANGGSNYSTGQKQKLSIARLLLRHPKVLVFDEATGILDKQEEKELQKIISEVSCGKTSVHIAHKLESIMDADLILVLADGSLVQKGTHEELMQVEGGNYQRLMELEAIKNWSQLDCSVDDRRSEHLSRKDWEMISTSDKEGKSEGSQAAELSKIIASTILGHRITWAVIAFPFLAAICCMAFSYGCGQLIFCYAALMAKFDTDAEHFAKNFGSMQGLWAEAASSIELLAVAALGNFIVSALATGWLNYFCEDFLHRLRISFARKMLYSDAEFHDQPGNQPAALSHLLHAESAEVREMLVHCLPRTIRLVFDMLFSFGFGFYICPPLALLAMVASFFITLFKYAESKVMTVLEDSNNKVDVTLLNESFHNARFVKSTGCQDTLVRRFGQDSPADAPDPNFSVYSAAIFGLSQIFCYFSIAFICRMSIWCTAAYGYSSREIMVALTVLLMSIPFLLTLNDNLTSIGRGLTGLRRIHEKMNFDADIEADPANPEAINRANVFRPKVKGKIEFRNVVFRYQGRCKNALNGVSFVLEPGQRLAVFGRSGAGKTTILDLLLRFYDPNQGEILIDDIDIRNFNLGYLRSLFSAFMQSPAIFQGSLKYNVVYNSRLVDEGLSRVMHRARLQEFTEAGAVECDRQLRASGDNLSGGQRQRIALARVLGKTGQVFVFDEATSAVDKANEVEIMKELSLASVGKTSILLSTRVTFMREANFVLAIEGGNVVERGEFEELMAKKGFFYRFSK